jgi:hypothetical protein
MANGFVEGILPGDGAASWFALYQRVAEIVVCCREIRFDFQSLSTFSDRFIKSPGLRQGLGKVNMSDVIVRGGGNSMFP